MDQEAGRATRKAAALRLAGCGFDAAAVVREDRCQAQGGGPESGGTERL